MSENPMTWVKAMAFGSSIATTLAALVGGGFFLGRFLDQRLGTQPWFQLLLILMGLILGGCYLVLMLRKFGVTDGKK